MNANMNSIQAQAQPWGIAALRVALGVTFLMHGWQKLMDMGLPGTAAFFGKLGVPAPQLAATTVTGIEIVGGILLIVGLASRWAAVPLAADMLAALFLFHLPRGFFVMEGGMEHALLMAAGLLVVMLFGSGALSVDGLLGRLRGSRMSASQVLRPAVATAHE